MKKTQVPTFKDGTPDVALAGLARLLIKKAGETGRCNTLTMEWTDDGCVATASGFEGVLLTCPRCQELLPRDVEHRCGQIAKKNTASRKKQ
jgi:hypothetical protein